MGGTLPECLADDTVNDEVEERVETKENMRDKPEDDVPEGERGFPILSTIPATT